MNIEPQLLRKREAARFLSMPISTLEKLTSKRQMPHVRFGRAVYYDVADLRAMIAANKITGPAESN